MKKNTTESNKNMEQLTIDRKTWLRGDDNSALLRSKDKKMCCLGFFLNQCGIPKKKLLGRGVPAEVLEEYKTIMKLLNSMRKTKKVDKRVPTWLINSYGNTMDCSRLINVNDAKKLNEKTREKQIADIFKEHNVMVKYIN